MTRLRLLPLALLAVLVAGVLSIPFFARPLRPTPSEASTLQAAVRHARGEGLTLPVPDETDATLVHAERLHAAPPLYALLASAVVRGSGAPQAPDPGRALGRSVARTVKVTRAAALIVGVLGWCLLAVRGLSSRSLGTLFAGLLAVAGGATAGEAGTAGHVVWAATPWWLGVLLQVEAAAGSGRSRRALAAAVGAGALGGLLAAVSWSALFLIPAAPLFLALRAWQARAARQGTFGTRLSGVLLGRLVLAAATVLAAGVAYVAFTTSAGGAVADVGGGLGQGRPCREWRLLATLYPFEAIFTLPLALQPLAMRAWRALDPARTSPWFELLWRFLLPFAALVALWGATRRARNGSPSAAAPGDVSTWAVAHRVHALAAATLATLVLGLAWTSLCGVCASTGACLAEARYYRPVWPLAAYLWLSLLDRLPTASRFRTAAATLLLVGVLYSLQAQGRMALSRLGAYDESWELVERVRALEARPGFHVVFDNDVSDYAIAAGPRLLARAYPDPAQGPRLVAGRAAELWFVRRLREPTAYVADRAWDRKRFDAVYARFGGRRAWVSSGGNYELWHATVAATPAAPE